MLDPARRLLDSIQPMFLSPLGERLGEGVQHESRFLQHPLTQPLPKGERSLRGGEV
jgi:hypothetical protein